MPKLSLEVENEIYKIMKKQFLTFLIIIFAAVSINAQQIDSVAVYLLDRMSNVIGDLNSFSLDIESVYDVKVQKLGLVKNVPY